MNEYRGDLAYGSAQERTNDRHTGGDARCGNGKGGEIRTREWSRNLRDRRGSRCAGNSCNSKRRTRSWPLVPELPSSRSLPLSLSLFFSILLCVRYTLLCFSRWFAVCHQMCRYAARRATSRSNHRGRPAGENATTSRVADAKRIAGLGRLLRITSAPTCKGYLSPISPFVSLLRFTRGLRLCQYPDGDDDNDNDNTTRKLQRNCAGGTVNGERKRME